MRSSFFSGGFLSSFLVVLSSFLVSFWPLSSFFVSLSSFLVSFLSWSAFVTLSSFLVSFFSWPAPGAASASRARASRHVRPARCRKSTGRRAGEKAVIARFLKVGKGVQARLSHTGGRGQGF